MFSMGGVKNWFEVCQFNRDNGSNYRLWTTCFMIRGDHWLSSRVLIIGVRNTVRIISGVHEITVRKNEVLLYLYIRKCVLKTKAEQTDECFLVLVQLFKYVVLFVFSG